MIHVNFSRRGRQAAMSGAYQYDTGQRLKLSGLPSPDILAEKDELLSGDVVTVQVHYNYDWNQQTESRLASYDEYKNEWFADVPDECLQSSEPVHVYVYVFYGADDSGERAQTMYEGTFTPIRRPAPNNAASPEQLAAWEEKKAEIEIQLTATSAAVETANTQKQAATEAASNADTAAANAAANAAAANDAADRLGEAGTAFSGLTVRVVDLAPGAAPTVERTSGELVFSIPQGADGAKGETGDTGPSDITITVDGATLTITPK